MAATATTRSTACPATTYLGGNGDDVLKGYDTFGGDGSALPHNVSALDLTSSNDLHPLHPHMGLRSRPPTMRSRSDEDKAIALIAY